MSQLLAHVIPLAFGAAISPVILMAVVAILGGPRAIPRAVAFTVGVAAITIAVSALGLLLIETSGHRHHGPSHPGPLATPTAHAVIGALLLLVGVLLLRPRPPRAQGVHESRLGRLMADEHTPLWDFGVVGAISMLTNASTLVLLLAVLHEVARAQVSLVDRALALALTDLIILLPALIPLGVAALGGDRAAGLVARMGRLMTEHGRVVIGVLLLAFGLQDLLEGLAAM